MTEKITVNIGFEKQIWNVACALRAIEKENKRHRDRHQPV